MKNTRSRAINPTPEDLQQKIDKYFEECAGVPTLTEDGKPVVNEYGRVCYDVPPVPPTMAGLTYACGYKDRHMFWRQRTRSAAFRDVVDRAKLRIEHFNELMLYDPNGYRGARINLFYNYGWKAGRDQDQEPQGINVVIKASEPDGINARAYAGSDIRLTD